MSAVRFVVVRLFVVVAVVGAVVVGGGLAGCQDPCVSLAERICNCEATANERRACIADRVTNQQSTTPVDDADRAFCAEKLDGKEGNGVGACSCEKLDNNDFEACGFANEPG